MNESRIWLVVPAGQQASGAWVDDALKRRVDELGLASRNPRVGDFPRHRVEVVQTRNPDSDISDLYHARGWTDGLPVIAPTVGRVAEMLRYTPLAPSFVLGEVEPLRGLATVEKVVANAVMAGCKPEYLPVVLAAVEAVMDPSFNLRGVQTTDENVAPLIVVNGPIARQLDINGSFGALGPGWRANASIGRALRLVMNNLGGGWPAVISFAGIGQAGRYTFCLAENETQSPWAPLHTETGFDKDQNTVTLVRAETAINVTGGLEELASTMGSAASAFTLLWSGKVTVIVAPVVAADLAALGWSKNDVRRWLHAHGRWSAEQWKASYLLRKIAGPERWPDWVHEAAANGAIPPVRSPDDIILIVAGGNIPIPQNVYFPSWGFPPACITREVCLPRDWDRLLAQTARVSR